MAKTAGPSPGSAKAKLRPQRAQLSRTASPAPNNWPSPQRGQRPLQPHTNGDAASGMALRLVLVASSSRHAPVLRRPASRQKSVLGKDLASPKEYVGQGTGE